MYLYSILTVEAGRQADLGLVWVGPLSLHGAARVSLEVKGETYSERLRRFPDI